MNALGQKMWRDLREQRRRGLLVVLAIALGIAGFTAVLSSYAILTRELDQGYLATHPASARLRTDRVDDELVAALEAQGNVRQTEARRQLAGRIRSGTRHWRNLQLFVLRDFGDIKVDKISRQEGAWPPALGEILIERDAFKVLQGQIGERVVVKTVQGTEHELRVAGSVKDVGKAQARMENIVYGYITLDTLALLGEEPFLDQIHFVAAGDASSERHVQAVEQQVESFLQARGHPVLGAEIPKPGKHPHADLMATLLLSKATFGLFVLALSGVLVTNLLSALMAAQIRQIGIMKTLGGSRRQIAAIYLGQVLWLGLAALALGLPFGLWGGRVLCRYLAVFLNFDITSFALPLWVYLLVALVGLLIPLLAAIRPVWKGCGVPVLATISDYGAAGNTFGSGAFDRLLARCGGAARPVLFALRNLFRRRARLFSTLSTLVIAGVFFLSALNLRASLIHTLDKIFAAETYDLTLVLEHHVVAAELEQALREVRGIEGMDGAPAFRTSDAGAESTVLRLRLASKDREAVDALKDELERSLTRKGLNALKMVGKAERRYGFDQHMVMLYYFLIIVSAILGSVGGLGLATTMSLNVLERRREIGVLRAIGASGASIRWIFVAEGMAITTMGFFLAALISLPFSRILGDLIAHKIFRSGLEFTVEAWAFFLFLAISLLLGALSSFLPAWRASRGLLREALAYS